MKEKWNKVGLLVLVVAALLWVGALAAGEVVCADGACGEEAQAEGFDASTAGDRFGQAHEDGVEGSAPPLDSAFPVPLSSTLTIVDGNQTDRGVVLVVDDTTKGWRLLVTRRSIIGGQWLGTDESIFTAFVVMTAAQFARPQADAYLLVGMGVGSAPKSLQTAGKTVDVVEISPAVVEFAEKHFGFKTNGKVHVKDALDFYQEKHRKKYDVIIQDTFDGGEIQPRLLAKETLTTIKSKVLSKNGLFVFNFVGFARGTRMEMEPTLSVLATLRSVFRNVRAYLDFPLGGPEESTLRNIVFFASDDEVTFCLPPHIVATASDSQEGDPYWAYNHFQQWEVTDWPSTILASPAGGRTKRKAHKAPSAKVSGAVVTLKRARDFQQQQQVIKEAYWQQISGFVHQQVWSLAEAG